MIVDEMIRDYGSGPYQKVQRQPRPIIALICESPLSNKSFYITAYKNRTTIKGAKRLWSYSCGF